MDWLPVRLLGEATLIAIGAFVVAYVVSLVWPRQHHPRVFGGLLSFTVVGLLAYFGSKAAGVALLVLIGGAVLVGAAGIIW